LSSFNKEIQKAGRFYLGKYVRYASAKNF